jgi:hypothetical protein
MSKASIKLITGYHLTQTRRRAILAIANAGLEVGRVGRINYRLTPAGDGQTHIKMWENESNGYGKMITRTESATVELLN